MMSNLFSTFDPATSNLMSMNWMSSMISLIIMPLPFWMLSNRLMAMFNLLINTLHKEFKLLMNNSKGLTIMSLSLFLFIMMNNMMGLLPYIFTSSSHMTFTLTMALPLWISFMMFGWINHTNHMFAHMMPMGTPSMLMPFMVLIETISNIIRPGSLAVRLTANMIAGHMLMSLLGNNSINSNSLSLMMIFVIQMMLMTFETAVALIQAYVFSMLSTLYASEVM
uniref:ATP synthase F0 subunit 6 n=1 Tax=Sastragala esakii TaxID=483949 RepID=UPI001D113A6A|nr:ATP synthase F0 subunit 6 [Sastragala esakii]UCC46108.1 ATP synthase F0 subunit 6 [Sastragala esakii]